MLEIQAKRVSESALNIKIGDIVTIKSESARYRIIAIIENSVILCRLDTNKFDLVDLYKTALLDMITEKTIDVEENNNTRVFDFEKLSDSYKEKYLIRKAIMDEVMKAYGPDYLGLCGKKPKKELDRILNKYSISRVAFWRICVPYFQSGFDSATFLGERCFDYRKGIKYTYNTKTGHKGEYGAVGVALSPEVLGYFEEALKEYKSGRQKSIRSCYDHMNNLHYTRSEIIGGVQSIVLVPENERPTYKQLYLYISKHLSKEDRDIIKTSQMEFRNNQRLLESDSLFGVAGPGDLVEIDACEADVSLVSMTDKNQTVGRPIVYFMIDVFTRIILAVSVAFDNNSLLGVTNLFLNLAENKHEYCEKHGISFDDDRVWPSCIIPNRIRLDRGSEFKSREFGRICNALGIQKDIVPGGSGSLKGVVEQSFHQMHTRQNDVLEDRGLIEKRFDSNHHEEATLNIEQYTKMVINFVLTHNQTALETYPLTKDMIDKKIKPVPALLWQYGIENMVTPRPITNKTQYCYDLMTPIKVSVGRDGIKYKGLYYISNESYISTLMFRAKNKKIPIEARMDMRDVGNIYVLHDNRLIQVPLNERKTGNAEYKGMTMKEYEDYRKEKGKLTAEGRIQNEELSAYSHAVNAAIVEEAAKTGSKHKANAKNIRPARETEKQRVSGEHKIVDHITAKKKKPAIEEKPAVIEAVQETEEVTETVEPVEEKETAKDYFNLSQEELLEEQKKALAMFEDEDW